MMSFGPRGIGDLSNNECQALIFFIKTVIKADWIKDETKITKMREKPYWSSWS